MHNHTFSQTDDAFVEGKLERLQNERRYRSTSQRLFRHGASLLAVTELDLAQINLRFVAIPREPQEKILQREIVQHHNARPRLHCVENAGVITMIVAHVIDNGIKLLQPPQQRSLPPIITNFKPRRQFGINRMKAIDEQSYVRRICEMRQQLFAVVANPRGLRTKRTEKSEVLHFTTWTLTFVTGDPRSLNQLTPSWTMSSCMVHSPGCFGAVICSVISVSSPGFKSFGMPLWPSVSDVNLPSLSSQRFPAAM